MKSYRYIVAGCKEWNLSVYETLAKGNEDAWHFVQNEDELSGALAASSPRYIFFLHWSWRVSEEIWSNIECVCFHMTDVPYGRGGTPLQNLILLGHENTVVAALRMVGELDAGPVYTKRPLSLAGRAIDIYNRAGRISVDIIRWLVQAEPVAQPQVGDPVVFKRRVPGQSELPMESDIVRIYDHIRMLDAPGYPLAFLDYGQFRFEFSNSRLVDKEIFAEVVVRKRPKKD